MGNIFAGSEIVEIGIQIEKNGRDFYSTLAGQSKSPKAKDIFIYLAGEEEKHIAVFQGILRKTAEYEPPESFPGEYFAYMRALASEHIFTQKDKGGLIARQMKSDIDAIEAGVGFEKDSIVFYEGMKKVVPQFDHKVIDQLITQEQHHLVQLLELKEQVA